ncbi:MAG: MBL fold metallo-hydrolase [Bacteroidota bacterium]|jgi:flavorubredoxin
MSNTIDLAGLINFQEEKLERPTPLYQNDYHSVYWLGTPENSAFRCNTYLITDGDEAIIVDPGGADAFGFIRRRVEQIIDPAHVSAQILCHQDPDVAGSMVHWLDVNPEMKVVTSTRTNILISHYGREDYSFFNITETPAYTFSSGRRLRFIEAPFLHFPGAFTTYDETSSFLFSGDIWAALDMDWKLVISDFRGHEFKMNLFHLDYMASNIAARGFVERLKGVRVKAILPQHGSLIPEKFVDDAIRYLSNLRCGLDIIYPEKKRK